MAEVEPLTTAHLREMRDRIAGLETRFVELSGTLVHILHELRDYRPRFERIETRMAAIELELRHLGDRLDGKAKPDS